VAALLLGGLLQFVGASTATKPAGFQPYPGPWFPAPSFSIPLVEEVVEEPAPDRAPDREVSTPSPPPSPKPRTVSVPGSSHHAQGQATWYCLPGVSRCPYMANGGLYAAAGPAIRVGDWRGRHVRVCLDGTDECVTVTLIDWCACGGDRVIDLFGYAFVQLGPLSRGVLRVKVSW
jgi:hypothetical protein